MKRPSKTIDIELQYIKNNNICPKILKDVIYEYNNKPYKLSGINCGVKINYNAILDEYYLLIPHKHTPTEITKKTENLISLDLGLRTFATGLSETQAYKIGNNVNSTIRDKLMRLNKIMKNENIPNKIKKKNEKMINRQIYGKIDDMHWKVISYLTKTFKTVVLGDMNAKSIVSSKNNIMSTGMKTACLRSRFFDFKQRLAYKCNLTKTNFILVDEAYTSKTCSCCGNYNDKLGGSSVYDCVKCKMKMDRDINSCRDMMIKSKIEN
jgi:IS605 OrfB family transposase